MIDVLFEKENYKDRKSIIIYFSRADENYAVGYIDKGNTEVIAEYIKELTDADMFKVERKIPYSKEYRACVREAEDEQENDERPELAHTLDNIDNYEVVYIGAPVYCGLLPQPMITQLEKLNWNGKVIRPFTTHEGSGLGNIPRQLEDICNGAKVVDGLAVRGTSVKNAKGKVEAWI